MKEVWFPSSRGPGVPSASCSTKRTTTEPAAPRTRARVPRPTQPRPSHHPHVPHFPRPRRPPRPSASAGGTFRRQPEAPSGVRLMFSSRLHPPGVDVLLPPSPTRPSSCSLSPCDRVLGVLVPAAVITSTRTRAHVGGVSFESLFYSTGSLVLGVNCPLS